jgi:hypothetical protein
MTPKMPAMITPSRPQYDPTRTINPNSAAISTAVFTLFIKAVISFSLFFFAEAGDDAVYRGIPG